MHSVGLQPDGELQIEVSASQNELSDSPPGKSRPNLFRAISVYHSKFAPTLRLPIAVTS